MLIILSTIWKRCTNSHTSSIPPRQPYPTPPGPYPTPPGRYRCRHCGSTNLLYRTVQPGNRNGNVGRPYYVCVYPHCPKVMNSNADHHETGWVTWDDSIGVRPTNPPCRCLPPKVSRQDTAGERSRVPGKRFWTCSTGACDYESWRLDGKEDWGPGF